LIARHLAGYFFAYIHFNLSYKSKEAHTICVRFFALFPTDGMKDFDNFGMMDFDKTDLYSFASDIQTSPFALSTLFPFDYTGQSPLGTAGSQGYVPVSFAESFEQPIFLFAAFAPAFEHFVVHFAAFDGIVGYLVLFVGLTAVKVDGTD
jgi:hypothetical protein